MNLILIFLMLFAMLLSLISIIMVAVVFIKTNSRIKDFFKNLKLYAINNLVERKMKKEKEYENLELFYEDYILKRPGSDKWDN